MNWRDSNVAFRDAIEARILADALAKSRANPTLDRKLLVFERFLARLLEVAPGQWVLKGGVALEFRTPGLARTTRDLDLGWRTDVQSAERAVMAAANLQLTDRMHFVVSRIGDTRGASGAWIAEFRCDASMAGRRFETVRIDVGVGDLLPSNPAYVLGTGVMGFAGIEQVRIPVLPIEQHVAEKFHAYTYPRTDRRENTRMKDLVDLVLISRTSGIDAEVLAASLDAVFSTRATHSLPRATPPASDGWSKFWDKEAEKVGLEPGLAANRELVGRWLDPVLTGSVAGLMWNPLDRCWEAGEGGR